MSFSNSKNSTEANSFIKNDDKNDVILNKNNNKKYLSKRFWSVNNPTYAYKEAMEKHYKELKRKMKQYERYWSNDRKTNEYKIEMSIFERNYLSKINRIREEKNRINQKYKKFKKQSKKIFDTSKNLSKFEYKNFVEVRREPTKKQPLAYSKTPSLNANSSGYDFLNKTKNIGNNLVSDYDKRKERIKKIKNNKADDWYQQFQTYNPYVFGNIDEMSSGRKKITTNDRWPVFKYTKEGDMIPNYKPIRQYKLFNKLKETQQAIKQLKNYDYYIEKYGIKGLNTIKEDVKNEEITF